MTMPTLPELELLMMLPRIPVPQRQRSASTSEAASEEQGDLDLQLKPYALIVDDSADIAFMLLMILQHAGYDAVMSLSGVEALALAQKEHFDLVVSDIGMPQMDGYALAKRLRALPGYASVPMLAITGFSEYDDRDRALTAGFNTHLTKPIDPTSFIELVKTLKPQH